MNKSNIIPVIILGIVVIIISIILHHTFIVLIKICETTDRNALETLLLISTISFIIFASFFQIYYFYHLLKHLISYVGSKIQKRGTKEV